MRKNNKTPVKPGLHHRNSHRFRYNFRQLINTCPGLGQYVLVNQYGDDSINFADPEAVKMLNRALLNHFYGISYWDIPDNYLSPPIPGRADYIHNIADLLSSCNGGVIPEGKSVSILDIGIGANCVYPIIGSSVYGWRFTGTDTDSVSIMNARKIIDSNNSLTGYIELRMQKSPRNIFCGIIKPDELFDITICNPPFHASPEDAVSGTMRKLTNLNSKRPSEPVLNFGGHNNELWFPGGEESFVKIMIQESSQIPGQCLWYSTLISKKTTLPGIYKTLKKVKASEVRTISMAQGQKISRIVTWSFQSKDQQKEWSRNRWN